MGMNRQYFKDHTAESLPNQKLGQNSALKLEMGTSLKIGFRPFRHRPQSP
jgi:hypothetical protein